MTEIETTKRPKKTQVSLNGAIYRLVRDEAKRRGVTIRELMDTVILPYFESKAGGAK